MKTSFVFLCAVFIVACSISHRNNEKVEQSVEQSIIEFRVDTTYTAQIASKYDSAELRIKRNEIFAQYGYKFKSEDLASYFSSKNWYEARYDNVNSFLTPLDKENIKTLLAEETQRKAVQNFDCANFPNCLPDFVFNSSIPTAIDSLGNPPETFLHEHLTCPIGQLHYWDDNNKNCQIVILGDNYEDTPNFQAKSRYYAIQSFDTFKPSKFSFNGIRLGDSEKSVNQKLNCLLTKNSNFELNEHNEVTIVEIHFVKDQKKQYVISKSGLYIRFIIDSNDRLKCIVFSSFNERYAC